MFPSARRCKSNPIECHRSHNERTQIKYQTTWQSVWRLSNRRYQLDNNYIWCEQKWTLFSFSFSRYGIFIQSSRCNNVVVVVYQSRHIAYVISITRSLRAPHLILCVLVCECHQHSQLMFINLPKHLSFYSVVRSTDCLNYDFLFVLQQPMFVQMINWKLSRIPSSDWFTLVGKVIFHLILLSATIQFDSIRFDSRFNLLLFGLPKYDQDLEKRGWGGNIGIIDRFYLSSSSYKKDKFIFPFTLASLFIAFHLFKSVYILINFFSDVA